MKAVIVAAGMGSRLWGKTNYIPKTLLPFRNQTILSVIIKNIASVGITNFVIVVGYQANEIIQYLKDNNDFGFNIAIVKNNDWQKGNGISVLAAENQVGKENFLLSMSDHIVSVNALNRIVTYKSERNLLLIDPKVKDIFDIDDATKVQVDNNLIKDIGKKISKYNGIDCGIFRLNHRFFNAIREQLKLNKDSISAAVSSLIQSQNMEAVFLQDDDQWIDIDTPEAYQHAIKFFV